VQNAPLVGRALDEATVCEDFTRSVTHTTDEIRRPRRSVLDTEPPFCGAAGVFCGVLGIPQREAAGRAQLCCRHYFDEPAR
jgi:hypothetical protein